MQSGPRAPIYQPAATDTTGGSAAISRSCPAASAVDWWQLICAVQGSLDNLLLLAGASAVERKVNAILDKFSGAPFIFNLGHGIMQTTPPDHVARLCEIVRGRGG